MSRVPLFAHIESVDDGNEAADRIQEHFVNEVFIQFEYKTFMPGDVLINCRLSANVLLMFC